MFYTVCVLRYLYLSILNLHTFYYYYLVYYTLVDHYYRIIEILKNKLVDYSPIFILTGRYYYL